MGIYCMTQGTQTGALQQAEGWLGEADEREVQEGGDMGVPKQSYIYVLIFR